MPYSNPKSYSKQSNTHVGLPRVAEVRSTMHVVAAVVQMTHALHDYYQSCMTSKSSCRASSKTTSKQGWSAHAVDQKCKLATVLGWEISLGGKFPSD